jgi:anti-sigma factor RsiW
MGCSREWELLMHNVIDKDASPLEIQKLTDHLKGCDRCKIQYDELVRINTTLEEANTYESPEDFTDKVLARLPAKDRQFVQKKNWFKRHPILTAASIFLLLMTSTLITQWNIQADFVSYEAQGVQLVINDDTDTVIVPKETIVQGDLVVRNGNARVDGTVHGDVIIINGEYMASAGNVVGESKEIKKITEWILYSLKNIF